MTAVISFAHRRLPWAPRVGRRMMVAPFAPRGGDFAGAWRSALLWVQGIGPLSLPEKAFRGDLDLHRWREL